MATAAKSTTVRVSERTHHALHELADQSGEPMQTVLDKAIEQYRRQRFLEECHAAYCTLQQNPDAWKEYQEELAVWDVALMDGLDSEETGQEDKVSRNGAAHG